MQRSRFAIQTGTIPVEDAIGRIRILLDLKNHEPTSNRMHPTARKEHGVSRADLNAMETVGDGAAFHFFLEFLSANPAPEADIKLRFRFSLGNIPHLRLGLSPELRRLGGRGMNLKRQLLASIEDLYEERKSLCPSERGPQQLLTVTLHHGMQIFAS